MASEQQPGGDPTSPCAPSPSEAHNTAISQNPNLPTPPPPPPGAAVLPRDLHLHLPVVSSSSSSLVKPVESQEQPAPRLHRPIATQAEVGVPAFIATATATATHNSSFQASSAPCTHTMSGFAPFTHNNNINAEHYLRGPPPPLQQGQRQQPQINIGLTIPLKTVSPVVPPATSMIKPFSATDADHCANEARDKCVDNALVVTIQDRKVRLSNTGSDSLYALCRCWVRSDIPRKDQHDPWDSVRPLPRPLSVSVAESNDEKSTEDAKEDNTEAEIFSELEGPVENISERQLLQAHVKHAKNIRARLRNERMRRIGRYKQRLALLLPSSMEQNKSDSAFAI